MVRKKKQAKRVCIFAENLSFKTEENYGKNICIVR